MVKSVAKSQEMFGSHGQNMQNNIKKHFQQLTSFLITFIKLKVVKISMYIFLKQNKFLHYQMFLLVEGLFVWFCYVSVSKVKYVKIWQLSITNK